MSAHVPIATKTQRLEGTKNFRRARLRNYSISLCVFVSSCLYGNRDWLGIREARA